MEENKNIEIKKENFILPIIFELILIISGIYLKYLSLTIRGEGVLVLVIPAYLVGILSVVFIISGLFHSIRFLSKKQNFYNKTPAVINLSLSVILLIVLIFGIFYENIRNNIQERQFNTSVQKDQDEALKNRQDICLHPEKYPKNFYTQFCNN